MKKSGQFEESPKRDFWRGVLMLHQVAPAIEAAGNLDRALKIGAIGGFKAHEVQYLRSMVPVSRGGSLSHPDADNDWLTIVAEAVQARDLDLNAMRRAFAAA